MKANAVSFKSKFIGYSSIKKLDANNKFVDCKSTIHELNPSSPEDIHLMNLLSDFYWGTDAVYAKDIDYNFIACNQYSFLKDLDRFYLLANNSSNDPPKAKDVLGIVQTRLQNDKGVQIVYMQVNPKYKYGSGNNMKYVGTAMVNALKEIYAGKELSLYAISKTIPFYLKHGFEKISAEREGSQLMKYKPVLNKLI